MDLIKDTLKGLHYSIPDRFKAPYRDYIAKLYRSRLVVLYLFSITLIPAAVIFDFFIFNDLWQQLLVARIVSMGLCLILLLLSSKTRLKDRPIVMTHVLNIAVTSTIVYLTSLTGGYASSYYAGLMLIFICMAMIAPMGVQGALLAGTTILCIYFGYNLIPPLRGDELIHWPFVWNSIYFLGFTFGMILVASGMVENYRRQLFVRTEEEKIRNRKLESSKRKIDVLMKTKNRFITNITHELKTPLSIVIGNSELALEKAVQLDGSMTSNLEIIKQAAFQLASHVDRIIAVSKADDPELKLVTDNYDYSGVLQNMFNLFKTRAKEEGIEYRLKADAERLVVNIDVLRIEEVLNNLLQNAFKFTDAGGKITVTVGTDGQQVYTEVADTGIGIPEERLDMIFKRLYQADEVLSKRHGGIGIGLYLCKRNVELHGGNLSVHSVAGRGSSFRFALPLFVDQGAEVKNIIYNGLERRQSQNRRDGSERRLTERKKKFEYQLTLGLEDLARMTHIDDIGAYENRSPDLPSILIVEDNPGMIKVITEALRGEYNLFLAENGFEALKKLREHTDKVNLILSDVMMPGMSGFEFCDSVMKNDEWKHIPLVFVTALLKEEDQLKGYALGATDYIVKPYNIKILKEKVAHWISRREYELLLKGFSDSLSIRLKDMSRMKDILLHELRNPLQIIMGAENCLSLMQSSSLVNASPDEKARLNNYLGMLAQGVEALNGVVETTKKIVTRELSFRHPESVEQLFDEALMLCGHVLKGTKVNVNLKQGADKQVLCDKRMLTQVFTNLLRNAGEAIQEIHPQGGGVIDIYAHIEDKEALLLKIADNGKGMASETAKNLFRFKFTTKKDGTGIGLNLSKIIIRLHEGNIWVESQENKGTVFTIELPLYQGEQHHPPLKAVREHAA